MTYYDILQVSPDASEEVIKAAYRSLVKKYHPDLGVMSDADKFIKVEEAYEVLSDSQKRYEYDKKLENADSVERERNQVSVRSSMAEGTKAGKRNKISLSGIGENLIGILFWGFVIYSWFGNAEKIRVDLLNLLKIQTFSESEEKCDAYFSFDFDANLLKSKSDVWINIDGNRVRLLAYGDSDLFSCELSKGQHIIFVETKTMHINSKKQIIQIEKDEEYFAYKLKGRAFAGVELYNGY